MGDVAQMNRKERRHWNKYVADAQAVFSEVVLREPGTNGEGDLGDIITVRVPSVDGVEALNAAEQTGSVWQQLEILMGDDTERFRALAGGAPITALTAMLQDIITDLGLSASPGNVPASSA